MPKRGRKKAKHTRELEELLYRALGTDHGIEVETNDVVRLLQQLRYARRAVDDPELEVLSFTPSRYDPRHRVWICKEPLNEQD